MPKTTNPATAADFVEYVAELRAEGMNDADVLVRYFNTARPGLTLRIHADAVAIYCDRCEIEWGTLSANEAGAYHVTITSGYKLLTTETFGSLESALAWLANQLAERCPVAALCEEEAYHIRHSCNSAGEPYPPSLLEYDARRFRYLYDDHPDEAYLVKRDEAADRIRRMFAIAEPGDHST